VLYLRDVPVNMGDLEHFGVYPSPFVLFLFLSFLLFLLPYR
jgi:hypothetical protein